MAIILIPAGIIAALIMFRWARTLALWAFGALLVWGYICFAHAEQYPMVQCELGSVSQVVPSYACDALTLGYNELRFVGEDTGRQSMMRCSEVIGRYVHKGPEQFINACYRMWEAETTAQAQARILGRR
jgi:hypothetical protein